MTRLGLYRLAAPNENCVGCGFSLPLVEYGEVQGWVLLAPGIDPAFFVAQNRMLCAECVLALLPQTENAWECAKLFRPGGEPQGRTLILAPRGEHSAKPVAFMEAAELVSHPPRLELFARVKRPGWTAWGDGVATEVLL